jgi:hypothetical protein
VTEANPTDTLLILLRTVKNMLKTVKNYTKMTSKMALMKNHHFDMEGSRGKNRF